LRVGKIQKIFDNGLIAAETKPAHRPGFRYLVNHKNAARHQQVRKFPEKIFFRHN
jgi:hypothetical protein